MQSLLGKILNACISTKNFETMTLLHREMLWYIIQYHYNKKGDMRHITKRENNIKTKQRRKAGQLIVSLPKG